MCSHELSRETRVMLREGCDSISFHNFALLEMELSYKWRVFILGTGPYLSRVVGGEGGGEVLLGFQLSQYEIYLIPPRIL